MDITPHMYYNIIYNLLGERKNASILQGMHLVLVVHSPFPHLPLVVLLQLQSQFFSDWPSRFVCLHPQVSTDKTFCESLNLPELDVGEIFFPHFTECF